MQFVLPCFKHSNGNIVSEPSYCCLRFFHRPQLVEFQQLELLDLNENSIESLDCAWFDALPRLRTLMLENNGMEEIKGKFRLAQARVSAGVVKMTLFKNKNKMHESQIPEPES